MDNTSEKNIIDDKWLENLQNEIKEQREDLEKIRRVKIKEKKIKKIYEEAVYGDLQLEPEELLKYMEDRIDFNDEEEKQAAKAYLNAIKRLIDRYSKIKSEKGKQNNMDGNKIVQALTEAFVPMFERIDNRLDNIETDIKDIKVRLTNVETRLTNVETDVRDIKLQIETHIIPALNAQNEGRHIVMEKQEEILERLNEFEENYIKFRIEDFDAKKQFANK